MTAQSAAPDVAQEERRVRTAKTVVLSLACVVGLSLVTAFVFGVYNFVTDRPAKEMFQAR